MGMRVIDSTPPPIPSWICPERIPLATSATAVRPLPQSRFTVFPGTAMGRPAASTAAARDVEGLLADLGDAAERHVLDPLGGHARALEGGVQDVRCEVDRVDPRQAPLPLAAGVLTASMMSASAMPPRTRRD
jgi:hypothetical protein